MKIAIIGGGIGGLTTAIALQRKGFTDITVYEAAPEIRPIGAGILLASNAMTIFDRLGIAEQIKAAGNVLQSVNIANHRGEILSKVDFSKIIKKYGHGTVSIHRGKLQEILLENANKSTVLSRKRLKNIVFTEGGTQLYFEDGTTTETDIVIGADGIHSLVRKYIFGDIPLRYSGQTCWRGIAKMRLDDPEVSVEMWGKRGGLRACVSQVSETEVYWYITLKHKAGLKLSETETKPYLIDLVSEFNSPIQKAVQLTDNQHILHNDLSDFKPIKTWYKDNIVLIGDAAHATTPNLGQGACQAIEDAFSLANCLKTTPSPMNRDASTVNEAFLQFQNSRIKKATFVVNTSYQIGQLNNIGGFIGYRLRNALMKLAPTSFAEKQFDYLFTV
jgi:FAD-dependent urate hydroxylase